MPISRQAFIRTTLLAMVFVVAAVVVIVGASLWLVNSTAHFAEVLQSARQQRAALIDLRGMMDDAETGQRGYLLTGNPDYLQPYNAVLPKIDAQMQRIRNIIPDQAEHTAKLGELIAAKLIELAQTIQLEQAGRHDDAMAIVRTNGGRHLMDDAREIFAQMIATAEGRVTETVRQQRDAISYLRLVSIASALVILAIVFGGVWLMLVYMRQLVAAQKEVEELNTGLEARVADRTRDLSRANDEIQRFAYIVTHDLRAPLVNIMGFTSELSTSLTDIQSYVRDENPDPGKFAAMKMAALEDVPEAIGFIRSSTQKMDGLINAILKLSREGRRTLKPETIQLDQTLQAAAKSVQHQAAEAGGSVTIEGDVPPVISDRLALEQVFGNLLDNAIKYRMPGRPPLVKVRLAHGIGRRIVVEVQDNGRGIAEQDHERVFELFRRSGTQDQPGEGIGLAHVRSMVRNLGGDITLKSQLGEGTTMIIDLPRDLRDVLRGF